MNSVNNENHHNLAHDIATASVVLGGVIAAIWLFISTTVSIAAPSFMPVIAIGLWLLAGVILLYKNIFESLNNNNHQIVSLNS